jgi:hypothetical protein
MDILEKILVGVVWIGLAQDKGKWRTPVNAVMNFRAQHVLGNYRVAEKLATSQARLSSTE